MAALCRMEIALQTRDVFAAPTSTLTFWGAASWGTATEGCAHPVFMQTVTIPSVGSLWLGPAASCPGFWGPAVGSSQARGPKPKQELKAVLVRPPGLWALNAGTARHEGVGPECTSGTGPCGKLGHRGGS